MELAAAWLVFPAVLVTLSWGWGNVVALAAGARITAALRLPLGLAAIVVVAGLPTLLSATARLALPLVVAGAVVGLAAAWPIRLPGRHALWPASVAALVFAAYGAPIVASGEATYAGYLTLDDTASLFAMTERVLDAGPTVDGLGPSTYEATLATTLTSGYPVGSLLPLGIAGRVSGEDVAWAFQPYLAVLAALLALVLWQLLAADVERRSWRLFAAVVAAQPAILYGYGLWTGVKELAAAMLIGLAAALVYELRDSARARSWVAVAPAVAAIVGTLSLGGAVWLLPLAAWLLFESRPARRVRTLVPALALVGALALPSFAEGSRLLDRGAVDDWGLGEHLANLVQPLNPLQAFGIWPSGDLRYRPDQFWEAVTLSVLVLGLAAVGFALAVRRKSALVPYASCALCGGLAYWVFGSPWIGAKALAIAAPAALALAALTCAWLSSSGRRVEAVVAVALVVGGVVWSNVLAYTNVNLAPRAQLAELEHLGEEFAGRGPALMTEYMPVGARYFLRGLDAEGASELRRHLVPVQDGSSLPKLAYANLDRFQLDGLLFYRTLVLRRSPTESRPPAPYERLWLGDYYEVWQRPAQYRKIVEHVSLGDARAAAVPPCEEVERLASRGSTVVATERQDIAAELPVSGLGRTAPFTVPRRGRYSIWLAGSTRDRVDAVVDGRSIGGARPLLNNQGQYVEVARADLDAGTHALELKFDRELLRPGTGGPEYGRGPVLVAPTDPERGLVAVPAARARQLCGRSLDWIEVLR